VLDKEGAMRRRILFIGLGAAAAIAVGSLPVMDAARSQSATSLVPVPPAEYRQTIEALKPPKRSRPVIAILGLNEGTEVSDFLSTYGVLKESGLAEVTAVASRADPIRLYPSISVDTQATTAQFDASHPEGADYVVVPAMEPSDDPAVLAWIKAQHAKGAKIISVCNGSLTLSAAGLLDGRKATGHWYSIEDLQKKHPTMQWVRDRRYVVDQGVATSTGITASIPLMMALVEAIGGRAEADKLAARLGVADWDARHSTAAFQLSFDNKKTFVLNRLSFWRHEDVGIMLHDQVDEISLGFMVDAYWRTELTKVLTFGGDGGSVESLRGLHLQPDAPATAVGADVVIEPQRVQPARSLDVELPRIASRYDASTADLVGLVMEYPWSGQQARLSQR
jgi:putative intracellular protease/amidase